MFVGASGGPNIFENPMRTLSLLLLTAIAAWGETPPREWGAPGNGQWIYLFRPENGVLRAEKLVNLSADDCTLEPNVTFTPDQKWIVFRSNIYGETHV